MSLVIPKMRLPAGGVSGLSWLLMTVLSRNEMGVTDVYIASDEPVMARLASNLWIDVIDDQGMPYVFDEMNIKTFVHGIYISEAPLPSMNIAYGEKNRPAWEMALRRHGSLHPATVIAGEVDGVYHEFRVRCTIQRQSMGTGLGLIVRVQPSVIPHPENLGLPGWLAGHVMQNISSGLVVLTGPTGSGKSTTIASLIEQINETKSSHILTIEDPIEYEFTRKKGIITQRELMVDVESFAQGVKDALRFVPDVILVGETRDAETMQAVVRAAESGHLVMTSMHAPSTTMAIGKMKALLGESTGDIVTLAQSLALIIAQVLIRDEEGKENILLYEILDCRNRVVYEFVAGDEKNAAINLRQAMQSKQIENSVLWDDRLKQLIQMGKISKKRAALLANDPDLRRSLMGLSIPSVSSNRR